MKSTGIGMLRKVSGTRLRHRSRWSCRRPGRRRKQLRLCRGLKMERRKLQGVLIRIKEAVRCRGLLVMVRQLVAWLNRLQEQVLLKNNQNRIY